MMNGILRRLINQLLNRGINMGIDQIAKGRHGAKNQRQPGEAPSAEEKLQGQRAAEMNKRAKDMAKLTRRMR